MFAIRITNTTAALIATMNNEVTPEVEGGETYFVYEDEEIVPYIVTYEDFKKLQNREEWTRKGYSIWQSNTRFAILIDQLTAQLVVAMNNGVLPSFDKSISTYLINECVPYTISSDDFYMLRKREVWTPLIFVVWQK